jgi:hypothetical protein
MRTAHTQGPWEVQGEGFVVGGEGDAPNADFVSLRYITAPTVSRDHEPEAAELEANARLFAAAPDLLAAVKGLRALILAEFPAAFECVDGERADTAIAKAEGIAQAVSR